MANTIVTPNMSLPNPVPGQDPGPDYASNIQSCFNILDQHNHSLGSGVQINPDGIDINADLAFNNTNNLTAVRSVRFFPQISPISASAPDLGCLYVSSADLYYNDEAGNQVRITQGGSLAGAAGTITGLPSGTASASYSSGSGTFVFQQATSTAANMDIASLIIRYPGSYPTPSGNYVALEASSALSTGYALVLPLALPSGSGALITSDTSGNLGYTNVDNSSLAITSNIIQVKSHGIVQGLLALRATGTTVAAGGIAIANSSSTFTTTSASPVTVTNQSVTITTTGRPVAVFMQSDFSGSGSSIGMSANASSGAGCQFAIVRGVTTVALYPILIGSSVNENILVPPSSFYVVDLPPSAGTYTYIFTVSVGSGAQAFVNFSSLVAYEI